MAWRAPGIAWLLVGSCLVDPSVWAQSQGGDGTGPRATAEETETGPSMEFLEFLGTWESSDGEWVDPTDVQAVDWPVAGRAPAGEESDDGN